MSYFGESVENKKRTLSNLDKVLLVFNEIHSTEDKWKIHDEIIYSIKKVFGDLNDSNYEMVQQVYELICGEPNVPNINMDEKCKPIINSSESKPNIKIKI